MTISKKCLAVLLALLLCLSLSTALAAKTQSGGLALTLSVDRDVLGEGDPLLAEATLTNHGSTAYQDISITLEYPSTLAPVRDSTIRSAYASLLPDRRLSLAAQLIAVPDPTLAGTQPHLPSTGDGARPGLWLALLCLCAAGLLRLGRQERRRLLALLCAASVMLGAAPCARANEETITLRVSETVVVMGQETQITAVVRCTPVRVTETSSELRALYVIEDEFPGGYSNFPNEYENNTALLGRMLSKATPQNLPFAAEYAYHNLTQEEILARIAELAGMQDENDAAFFYITCHGWFDSQAKVYTNELFLSDGSRLHISDLADALAAIPGRVIVVLDYCGSGLSIGRSAAPAVKDGYAQFAKEALRAFADADVRRRAAGRAQADGSLLDSGKFCVITGASGTQSSWTNTEYGSYLLQWMNSGVMDADADGDGAVTLREMGAYLQEQGRQKSFFEFGSVVHMIPQFYPEESGYPLFVP